MTENSTKNKNSSYRQIMKATSIFGGVQVFNIIISIVRSKVIALLLGPAGMGIAGLLNSTLNIIGSISNFGLGISAVKDIAEANQEGDEIQISRVIIVMRRLVWFTGLLGAIATFFLAPWLSELSFGNHEYTIAFRWLSITLLVKQLSSGQFVLLQGMRKLNHLAKANMLGSVFGLIITIPLYYYYNIEGIVPAIIITAFMTLAINRYFSSKIKIRETKVSAKETKVIGKGMLVLGFVLSLSGLMASAESYVVRIFISNIGGIEEVGLYNAGVAIITTYVGLVFTAMGTDYYPRLAGVSKDNVKTAELINQQAEIAVLILAPILATFLIFINWVIIILYSDKFIGVSAMIYWAALGMFFKAASWCIAFIFPAKGASKLYFWNELVAIIILGGSNVLGYYLAGLTGLGISFLVAYFIYLIQVFLVAKTKYDFSFHSDFLKIFIIQFLLTLCCFLTVKFIVTPWSYFIGMPFILISLWYSYKELDKRINIKGIINKFRNKFRNK
ncbi:O-antigen translocase [Maribacter luteus]|uniref:Oligosaccharide flippase family protein n=1 Tax=Maribacter luteus TaxID=2594478 RepID=A0A6I2MKZ8_9FLAO|nr:O-antigen translocase [Maribacter luteus]MRX63752.1 oligosaccharide flippase family protein [Maribacter luteus]